jgi:hypothetical protein
MLVCWVIFCSHTLHSATYYTKAGQNNPNLLTNWTLNPDGTGANPANFTSGDVFIIQSGHTYATTAAWTLQGVPGEWWGIDPDNPATLQVDGTLTLNHTLSLGRTAGSWTQTDADDVLIVNGTIVANVQNKCVVTGCLFNINNGGRYVLNHVTNGNATTTFNGVETFAAGSTFEYRNHGTDAPATGVTYSNLDLNAAGIDKSFAGSTLTINGNLTVYAGAWGINRSITIGGSIICSGGTLAIANSNVTAGVTVAGNVTVNGGNLYISNFANSSRTNTLTINGNLFIEGGILDLNAYSATSNNNGQLYIKGNVEVSGGTLRSTRTAAGGSTGIYFAGIAEQNFKWSGGNIPTTENNAGRRFYYKTGSGPTGLSESYNGVTPQKTICGTDGAPAAGYAAWPGTTGTVLKTISVNNLAGVTLTRNVNINTKLLVYKGTFTTAGYTLSYGNDAILEYAGTNWQIGGDEYVQATMPTNIVINNVDGVTLEEDRAIQGNLTILQGTLDLSTHTLNRSNPGGTLSLDAGTTLKIGGTGTLPANFSIHSIHPGATVEYYGTNQQVAVVNSTTGYGHLKITGTGTKTLAGNVTVAGNLTVNTGTGLTVAGGQNLTVKNSLLNNGSVVLENNANLLQDPAQTSNTNTGIILAKRKSAPLYQLDYTIWSSPVTGTQTLKNFSPLTVDNRFYSYNTATDAFASVNPAATTFATGKGYLIRVAANHPAYVNNATPGTAWEGSFTGVPNNGNINVALSTAGNGFNCVGNPYPSPINVASFYAANSNVIDGTIWIWRKKNNAATNTHYVTMNSIGIYIGNNEPGTNNDPNGIIRTGQGFMVKLKQGYTSNSLKFTNAMRSSNVSNHFFRMNDDEGGLEMHGIWLNLTNPAGFFAQMYMGYVEGATMGVDDGIDSEYFTDRPTMLASMIGNDDFIIQGRSLPFTANDTVPLLFKAEAAGTFTIAIDHVNGLFLQGQQVYLYDSFTNTVHNLQESGYTFTTEAGTFSSRFEIVYTNNGSLGIQASSITPDDVVVYQNNGRINISSGKADIEDVTVFDIHGRLLFKSGTVNSPAYVVEELAAQGGVLIVNIKTTAGRVSKKIIY